MKEMQNKNNIHNRFKVSLSIQLIKTLEKLGALSHFAAYTISQATLDQSNLKQSLFFAGGLGH